MDLNVEPTVKLSVGVGFLLLGVVAIAICVERHIEEPGDGDETLETDEPYRIGDDRVS